MKKLQILISFICFTAIAQAQSPEMVTLRCRLDNCSVVDSIVIYQPNGLYQQRITAAMVDKNGEFTVKIPKTKTPQYFNVGINTELRFLKTLLLGTEKDVLLTGPCHDPTQTIVQNSPINAAIADAQGKMNALKVEMGKIMTAYNRDYYTDSIRIACEKQMLGIDNRKLALLDSLKKKNPLAARGLALDTYTTYQNNVKKMQFKSEIAYFASQYFQYVNWADTDYNMMPPVFTAFRDYTAVLSMKELGLTRPQIREYLTDIMKNIPAKSPAYRFALTGALSVFLEKQNPLLVDFGSRYTSEFPNDDATMRTQIMQLVNVTKANMVDVPATDIVQADTANIIRKLSDLKGKVVLVDFWASWCGPCRKENPTVVALYKKYKDKGFEVFSVSLDQNKERWIDAIAKDGLIWPNHVSDLKGWGNQAAALYSVSSIPKTVLIDKNGNITDHNLRGEQLEKRLKEIFGE